MQLTIATPGDMEALGARIASELRAGDLVALDGALGAGKTTFTRGLGAALGVRGPVTSPTFVLARTHPRPDGPPLVHVDAYRLSSPAELDDLDLDLEGSIVVVEWAAGMIDGLADSWLEVAIVRPGGGAARPDAGEPSAEEPSDEEFIEPREVTITGHGPRFADFRL
jgi:tRNA threonylcarbamoyl adenosine modification protein YjeE